MRNKITPLVFTLLTFSASAAHGQWVETTDKKNILLAASQDASQKESDDIRRFEQGRNAQKFKRAVASQASTLTHDYDILKYTLQFKPAMTSPAFSGDQKVRFKSNQPSLTKIALNSVGLTIDAVKVSGTTTALTYTLSTDSLFIVLASPLVQGDSTEVEILYHGTGNTVANSPTGGYFYYTPAQTTFTTLGYTMSEPYDARRWMPCYDDPSDKADNGCEISITVPVGYLAASNGLLQSRTLNGDGTETFAWKTSEPIATYLMCSTVSQYAFFTDKFVRAAGDTVPIWYYVWPSDSAAATSLFSVTPQAMQRYQDFYGVKYPHEKYGMAAAQPFYYGGMEHQTMTTINRAWIPSNAVNGIVHELSHQWWGDMVTCGSFKDIWLNEGFATYSEAIYNEGIGGSTALKNYMISRKHFTDPSWQLPIYNPPAQYQFGDMVYAKAGWVLHMLRYTIGDSAFRATFPIYAAAHKYSTALTTDFQAAAEQVSGQQLGWFFNQWIYAAGWPIYNYVWNYQPVTGGQYDVFVKINQAQSGQVFNMPIDMAVQAGGTTQTFRVVIDSTQKQFTFRVASQPTGFVLDPNEWVLKQANGSLSVEALPLAAKGFRLEQNYPNPFNPVTTIRYQLAVTSNVSLKVYDVLGREVLTLVRGQKPAGTYEVQFDGSHFTSGVYFYKLTANTNAATLRQFSEVKKMMLVK
jgi:aminopeptidase N